MDKKDIYIEKLLNIEIFEWSGWDEAGDQSLQYYDVQFHLDELKQYNGSTVCVPFGWEHIEIYHEEDYIKIDLLKCKSFVEKIIDRHKE